MNFSHHSPLSLALARSCCLPLSHYCNLNTLLGTIWSHFSYHLVFFTFTATKPGVRVNVKSVNRLMLLRDTQRKWRCQRQSYAREMQKVRNGI